MCLIELSAAPVPPLTTDAADDPTAGHQISASCAAEGENKMAKLEICRVAEPARTRSSGFYPQDRQVSTRISPNQFRRHCAIAIEQHLMSSSRSTP